MPRALTWLDDVAAWWEASGGPEADATAADALSLVAALAGADGTARQLALAGGAVAVALGLLRRNATGSAAGPARSFPRSSHAGFNVVTPILTS